MYVAVWLMQREININGLGLEFQWITLGQPW